MARTNYCSNPSCEVFTNGLADGWTENKSTANAVTYSEVVGASSPKAMRVQYTAAAGDANAYIFLTGAAVIDGSLVAADPATWQSLLKCGASHSGVTVTIQIAPYNVAWGALAVSSSAPLPLDDSWNLYSVSSASLPATTAYVTANILLASITDGDVGDLYIDNAMLDKFATLRGYFDGDTSGAYSYWTGARNASTSVSDPPAAGANPKTLKLNTDFWGA